MKKTTERRSGAPERFLSLLGLNLEGVPVYMESEYKALLPGAVKGSEMPRRSPEKGFRYGH